MGLVAALESRLGGDLCPGMPWLPPEHFEAPQGMLERPEGCQFPKRCAQDRTCWAAKQRELAAHKTHERILKREAGAEPDLRPLPVAKLDEAA